MKLQSILTLPSFSFQSKNLPESIYENTKDLNRNIFKKISRKHQKLL